MGMKIMQINIWAGRMARGLVRYIEKEQPDIICMQEVFGADFSVPTPDRMFDILSRLKEASGLEHEYFSRRYSIDVIGKTAPYGNAILSRFPFVSTRVAQIENEIIEHMDTPDEVRNIINVQIVTVNIDGEIWTIANHHGHHEYDPDGNDDSVAAMRRVADELQNVEGPLVLCGDLNVRPKSPAMRVFDNWLDDIVVHSDARTTLARINVDRDIVCDHLLINDKVVVKSFKVDNVIISDHYPLVAELETKG